MKTASGLGFVTTEKSLGNGSLGRLAGGWTGVDVVIRDFGGCAGFGDTEC